LLAADPAVIILTHLSRNVVLQRDPHPKRETHPSYVGLPRLIGSLANQACVVTRSERHLGAFVAMYCGLT